MIQHPNHPLTRWARIPREVDPGPTLQLHYKTSSLASLPSVPTPPARRGRPLGRRELRSRRKTWSALGYVASDELRTTWSWSFPYPWLGGLIYQLKLYVVLSFHTYIYIHMLFAHVRIGKIIYLYQFTHLQYQIHRQIVHSWLLCWFTGWPRNWIGRWFSYVSAGWRNSIPTVVFPYPNHQWEWYIYLHWPIKVPWILWVSKP